MPLSTFLPFAHQFGFDAGGGGFDPAFHSVHSIEESTVVALGREVPEMRPGLLSPLRNVLEASRSPQRVVGVNIGKGQAHHSQPFAEVQRNRKDRPAQDAVHLLKAIPEFLGFMATGTIPSCRTHGDDLQDVLDPLRFHRNVFGGFREDHFRPKALQERENPRSAPNCARL